MMGAQSVRTSPGSASRSLPHNHGREDRSIDSEPSASLDLLDLPTPQGLWLKQTSYSREDHDQAMRNRKRR